MKKSIVCTAFLLSMMTFPLFAKTFFRIGYYENPPKIYTDKLGRPAGFWADLARYIARENGWALYWVHGTWEECLERLENKGIDILVDVGDTPERREKFLFSDETVLLSWSELYVRKDSRFDTLMDLQHKKIAGLQDSFNLYGPGGLQNLLEDLDIDAEIIPMDTYDSVFKAVQSGEVFAGITNKDFGTLQAQNFNLARAPLMFQPARLQFALPKAPSSEHLRQEVDSTIRMLKVDTSSVYYSLLEKYFGPHTVVTVFPRWIIIAAFIVLGILIVIMVFIFLLRRQVAVKTEHLHNEILLKEEALRQKAFILDTIPEAVWLEDTSFLLSFLQELSLQGAEAFSSYAEENPQVLETCLQKISVRSVNKAALLLFEADSSRQLIQKLPETFTADSSAVFKKEIMALAAGEKEFSSMVTMKTLGGQTRRCFLHLVIPVDKGKMDTSNTLVTFTDLTRSSEQDELIRMLNAVVQQSPNSIVITNTAGLIEYVNPAYCRMTGYTGQEVLGKNPRMLQSGRTPQETYPELWETVLSGEVWQGEFINRSKSGDIYIERAIIAPVFNETHAISHLLGIKTDITKQKETEKELNRHREHLEHLVAERTKELQSKQTVLERSQKALVYLLEDTNEARHQLEILNQKLEKANEELESFSYSISHDLRSPLRAIRGYVELLSEHLQGRQDSETERIMDSIDQNTVKMGELIDDLLAFSRVGRVSMRLSPVDMKKLGEQVFNELVTPAQKKRIAFSVDDLPVVNGSRHLLREVWMNLIGNAVKFSSKKEKPEITISSENHDGEIVYRIEDNGAGFDPQYKDKLFEVFKRLHTDREFEGTGIGLALVKRIIERHGGRVWGEGEVQKGAVFYFTLPGELSGDLS